MGRRQLGDIHRNNLRGASDAQAKQETHDNQHIEGGR